MSNTGDKGWTNRAIFNIETDEQVTLSEPNAVDGDYIAPIEDLISCPIGTLFSNWIEDSTFATDCTGQRVSIYMETFTALSTIVVGSILYTDRAGTIPLVGGNTFWWSEGSTKQYKIDNVGEVLAISTC